MQKILKQRTDGANKKTAGKMQKYNTIIYVIVYSCKWHKHQIKRLIQSNWMKKEDNYMLF